MAVPTAVRSEDTCNDKDNDHDKEHHYRESQPTLGEFRLTLRPDQIPTLIKHPEAPGVKEREVPKQRSDERHENGVPQVLGRATSGFDSVLRGR